MKMNKFIPAIAAALVLAAGAYTYTLTRSPEPTPPETRQAARQEGGRPRRDHHA
jgi:hypothetical protein